MAGTYGLVVLSAGLTGLLSFTFLALAIGTDYWYIIDVNKPNHTGPNDLSSHSGLWRIIEGLGIYIHLLINHKHIFFLRSNLLNLDLQLCLHKVVVILLPLSLVLLVLGWIFGLVSSLACSPKLLSASASYILLCGLFTLSGVSVYIKYSNQAMEEFQRIVSPENLVFVHVSFGWSLALAWLSYSLEVAAGLLLTKHMHVLSPPICLSGIQ
uniref:Transmembrane protein 235 n=1 Tax=Fundulus heteroclitus TaxID=8078 RepID=A0A3Q2QG47_FUNHE